MSNEWTLKTALEQLRQCNYEECEGGPLVLNTAFQWLETLPNITHVREVWAAISNTDLAEGRGYPVTLGICELKETAIRIGNKKGPMGSQARVRKIPTVRVFGEGWYGPLILHEGSSEDKRACSVREAKEAVLQRARDIGLTDEDLKSLKQWLNLW